ncbi:MAG: flavodoxin [Actinomycetota bacterium]|jgi:menaquinone-dependent protoporphyrinogen oxidase|nr:flavodoxin [Actinomycetota bacterium]
MASVLVAHATKYGSTQEVADAVAARLCERGDETYVRPASDNDSLDGYDAGVVGGALYCFRRIREGRRFLSRHRKALSEMPVAVFGMGPIEDTDEQFVDARKHLDKSLDKNKSLSPVAVTVFGGALDPTRLRFPDANPAMKNVPPSDLRDWKAIETWADSLPEALGLIVD